MNLRVTESKKFLLNFFTSEEWTKAISLTLVVFTVEPK